ncbi:MAG: glycoside hydrolase domain-containing protein, partial [Bacteroidota bacterium]
YVPHDVNGLMTQCGGKEDFIARLDTFFVKNYYNVGNEPSFLTPTLYNYAGRQDKTAETVRSIISNSYSATRGGIPGNDDSGSMSAWLAFHLMGFYPNAGQDLYLVTAPHFDRVTLQLDNAPDLIIETKNLSDRNIYIQKVLLNGQELNRSWLTHTELQQGGQLEFHMGKKQNNDWEVKMPPADR